MVFGRETECVFESYVSKSVADFGCSTAMLKKVTRAKAAVFTSALDIAQTETKVIILMKNADENTG